MGLAVGTNARIHAIVDRRVCLGKFSRSVARNNTHLLKKQCKCGQDFNITAKHGIIQDVQILPTTKVTADVSNACSDVQAALQGQRYEDFRTVRDLAVAQQNEHFCAIIADIANFLQDAVP